MPRTSLIQEERSDLRAEATWGNASAGPDVVALRAENDQLQEEAIFKHYGLAYKPVAAANGNWRAVDHLWTG
ncbi:hypothetical protein ABT063_21970 [Streptomyces sp. NPDC002838]|uniref:hypothetical protein n=1 Tax=Streptomyces sp. NPDC002838 TaxID=3154436 RepID=UPI003330B256